MIKLVASDLDGTIIGRDHTIFENNLKAINDINKKNIDFVICTGKTYPIIKGMCSKFNASYGIFGNGNQIINLKTGEEIYKKLLTDSEIDSCIDIARKHNLHIHIYTDNEIVTEELKFMDLRNYKLQQDKYYDTSLGITVVDDIKQYLSFNRTNVCKLIISSETDLSDIKNKIIGKEDISITTIKKYGKYKDNVIDKEYEYLDISPLNVSKGTALEVLTQYLELNKENVLSVGDNINDIEMFRASGIGAAVNNAYDEVKQVASYVTTNSAENAGFAEAVYKFVPLG